MMRVKRPRSWNEGEEAFTKEELEELRKVSPEFLRRDMQRNARCPGCGKEGRPVGGTFRACAQGDDRGWARVKEMLDTGEEFSYCVTEEEQKEVIQEGERLKESRRDKAWEEERKRRIAELKEASETGQRTKAEERKLDRIRGQKQVIGR